ncbi:MAG: MarR family transcriptional regulator [Subtercola sp.]|nr:MarR family transcriptional regulator [Subtercola sp.]
MAIDPATELKNECTAAEHQVDADVTSATLMGGGSDFGWALGTLLRSYLGQMGDAVSGLTGGPRAYQVMTMAAAGSCQNQAAIAERMGLDRTLMTYLVDGLEKQGLVVRTPDPLDRRSRRVDLTPAGKALHAQLAERVRQVECSVLGSLPTEDAAQLRRLLGDAASSVDARAEVSAPA